MYPGIKTAASIRFNVYNLQKIQTFLEHRPRRDGLLSHSGIFLMYQLFVYVYLNRKTANPLKQPNKTSKSGIQTCD